MNTKASQHAFFEELNELQNSTLTLLSAIRDEIDITFGINNDKNEILRTLKQLFHYMSGRSQAVSYLLSSGYPWDAEIVLRSFYETSAKIWFICFEDESTRAALVQEFWGLYASTHDHKKKHRARHAHRLSESHGSEKDTEIFSALLNDEIFPPSPTNRRTRKDIEKKWSFTEIIQELSKSKNDKIKIPNANALFHMYGLQSHLIHADDAALDLMLDRALRSSDELPLLEASHASRIMSDQSCLWIFSLAALRRMQGADGFVPPKISELWDIQKKQAKTLSDQFFNTQRDFYEAIKNKGGRSTDSSTD